MGLLHWMAGLLRRKQQQRHLDDERFEAAVLQILGADELTGEQLHARLTLRGITRTPKEFHAGLQSLIWNRQIYYACVATTINGRRVSQYRYRLHPSKRGERI